MPNKKNLDYNSPEYRAALREIVHGTFVREGTLVAFPLCFPDVTVPIPPDESRITALDLAADGNVYGGTSGRRTHLWVGMFHGATGMVYDLGVVAGADHCAAIACGAKDFIAAVNGPGGGRLIRRVLEPLPFDLVQEWYFERKPFQDLGLVVPGECIVHAVMNAGRDRLAGVTDRHLFVLDPQADRAEIVADLQETSRLFCGSQGGIFGLDADQTLWRWDTSAGRLDRRVCALPKGSWTACPWAWARDGASGVQYIADAAGALFVFTEDCGFSGPLDRTPLAPVGAMAVTRDGRVFGFCGDGIAQMFCCHPNRLPNPPRSATTPPGRGTGEKTIPSHGGVPPGGVGMIPSFGGVRDLSTEALAKVEAGGGFDVDSPKNIQASFPDSGRLDNLGCAVSVIQRRRYGYQFAAAITGRDGEIYFGEDDNGGHLWLYFPRVEPKNR